MHEADAFLVLLVTIPIGNLGDHHGRRQIMALSLVGFAGALTEMFVVCTFVSIKHAFTLLPNAGLTSDSRFQAHFPKYFPCNSCGYLQSYYCVAEA